MKALPPILVLALVFPGSGPVFAADPAGEALFEKKCAGCHDMQSMDHPPEGGWEAKLEKMARIARLKEDEKQEMLDFLRSHEHSAVPVQNGQRVLEEKCGRCHTLERVYSTLENSDGRIDWKQLLERMQQKEAGWLSQEDAEQIYRYLLSQRSSEAP